MLEQWDVVRNGIICNTRCQLRTQNKVVTLDPNTRVRKEIATMSGPLPAGDLAFAAREDSIVFSKQGRQENDIGMLLRRSAIR